MTGTQILVLALIGAAFAAGWVLRGQANAQEPGRRRRGLGRAISVLDAACDAYEQRALGELTERLSEAERQADRLLEKLGGDHRAVVAYERALNSLVALGRTLGTADQAAAADARRGELAAAREELRSIR